MPSPNRNCCNVITFSSSLQEVAGPRAVVVLQTQHVPQPAVQISEGRHRAAARQSLREAAAAGQRRAERQLRLRGALPRVRGDEGQTGPQDAAAGERGTKVTLSKQNVYLKSKKSSNCFLCLNINQPKIFS